MSSFPIPSLTNTSGAKSGAPFSLGGFSTAPVIGNVSNGGGVQMQLMMYGLLALGGFVLYKELK